MTEQTIETVALPGGGTGFKLPNGEVANPVFISASNMARQGQAEFEATLGWIEGERERRARRLAEHEASIDHKAIHEDVVKRHQANREYQEAHPWA
jgi:hypothetical protein